MNNKVQVILQARTGSKRLYGKSLLPITNEPLVVLCNRRLKNKDLKIITLIPTGKEDNYLAYVLKKNKLKFFRGHKLNVLKRFRTYTKKLKEDDIVIRVTADNPFVDGVFLKKLLNIYKSKKLEYFSAHDNIKNLPYGIQAEIFKVKHLRETTLKNKYNSEHVTPEIKKKYLDKNIKIFLRNYSGISNLKLSIDTLNDLNRVKKIFFYFRGNSYSNLSKIVRTKNLEKKISKNKISKILLGTVQIGKKYFQKKFQISQARANNIIKAALKEKINFFDTAHDYGKSEKFIGNFRSRNKNNVFICSKLKNLNLNKRNEKKEIINKINFSIFESLNRLKCAQLENFLVHNSADLFNSKILYNHLKKFTSSGIIKNLGVSIYNPLELKKLNKYKEIKCVQLPFNLIDHRWIKFLNKANNNLKIFIRSIFLRGNLTKNEIKFPKKTKKTVKVNDVLRKLCMEFKKKDFYELTLAYLKSFEGISNLIIGAQTPNHIKEFKNVSKVKKLNAKQKEKLIRVIKSNINIHQLDLRNWN